MPLTSIGRVFPTSELGRGRIEPDLADCKGYGFQGFFLFALGANQNLRIIPRLSKGFRKRLSTAGADLQGGSHGSTWVGPLSTTAREESVGPLPFPFAATSVVPFVFLRRSRHGAVSQPHRIDRDRCEQHHVQRRVVPRSALCQVAFAWVFPRKRKSNIRVERNLRATEIRT